MATEKMSSSPKIDNYSISENLTNLIDNSSLTQIWAHKSAHDHLYNTPIKFVGYCELFVCLLGGPANIIVLYLTAKILRTNFRRTASSFHQSNLWFVASMTTADALFCLFHSPMMVVQYVFGVHYDAPSCFFMYIITHSMSICSSLSLLWLNVDKFLYLNRPLHYHRRVTTMRALGAIVFTWAISLCWAIFFMLGPFTKYSPPCNFRPSEIHFYIVFAVCFFVLPTLVSLAISIYIASVVVRVGKENAIRKSSTRSGSGSACIKHSPQRTNAKAIVFVFTTTLWSSLTYLPYRFAYLFYISPGFKPYITWSTTTAFYFLFALMAVNAAGNPFITVITQRRYTTATAQLWRWVKARLRGRKPLRRKSSSNAASTLMTFQSVTSKVSMKRDSRSTQSMRLLEDPDRESAL